MTLQEAQSNPALGPTVQALMQSHIAEPSHCHGKGREDEPKEGGERRSLLHKRLLKNDDLLIL